MDYLPAFLDLRGRRALVVGAGQAAVAKAGLLAQAGAQVEMVVAEADWESATVGPDRLVSTVRRRFTPADVEGRSVVVAASGDLALDRTVVAAAKAAGVLVNVVDRPELSGFVFPAIVDRGPVIAAVATGGAAPVLARRLRAAIERALPANLGELARFLRQYRHPAKALYPSLGARRAFWEEIVDGPIGAAVLAGDLPRAREMMLRRLNRLEPPHRQIIVIGNGAGDPDLMTVRAVRAIEDADLLAHDAAVDARTLDRGRREAIRLRADRPNPHEVVRELIDAARRGRRVVRALAGDPAAEIYHDELSCLARDVPIEVVPVVRPANVETKEEIRCR